MVFVSVLPANCSGFFFLEAVNLVYSLYVFRIVCVCVCILMSYIYVGLVHCSPKLPFKDGRHKSTRYNDYNAFQLPSTMVTY